MRYLPQNLKDAYDADCKKCKDINGINAPLQNASDIIKAHYILADYLTDFSSNNEIEQMLVGLRSETLLGSTIGRQVVQFEGKKKYTTPIEICATLFYGIVKNHAFHDGNKRTALLVLINQMYLYSYYPNCKEKDLENLVINLAAKNLETKYETIWNRKTKNLNNYDDKEVKVIINLLKKYFIKKDTSFHIDVTMKEFCSAIEKSGVIVNREGNKIKFEKQNYKKKKLTYTVNFYGWTRTIEPKMARDTFSALGLLKDYSSYQALLTESKPMYSIIKFYEKPLRRLKDE